MTQGFSSNEILDPEMDRIIPSEWELWIQQGDESVTLRSRDPWDDVRETHEKSRRMMSFISAGHEGTQFIGDLLDDKPMTINDADEKILSHLLRAGIIEVKDDSVIKLNQSGRHLVNVLMQIAEGPDNQRMFLE